MGRPLPGARRAGGHAPFPLPLLRGRRRYRARARSTPWNSASSTRPLTRFNVCEWYRFLNLGYRLASVGGTDKMTAGVPVGASRTYAHLGDDEFSFANWAKAVRAGRTFTTTGPLLDLRVEGRAPGDEIRMPEGGGTVEVEARCRVGPAVRRATDRGQRRDRGSAGCRAHLPGRQRSLHEKIRLPGSAWVAARCCQPEPHLAHVHAHMRRRPHLAGLRPLRRRRSASTHPPRPTC